MLRKTFQVIILVVSMTKEDLIKFVEENHIYRLCFYCERIKKEIVVADKYSMFANYPELRKEMPDGVYLMKRGDDINHLLGYANWKEMIDGKLWEYLE